MKSLNIITELLQDSYSVEEIREALLVEFAEVVVSDINWEGNTVTIQVDGASYTYSPKSDGYDLATIVRKFEGIKKFSIGKAFAWLKRNTVLAYGSSDSPEAKLMKQ